MRLARNLPDAGAQQAAAAAQTMTPEPTKYTAHLCVPDDQVKHLPKRRRAPDLIAAWAPIPKVGGVICLSRNSAWGVLMVVHDWQGPAILRVEVCIEHVSSERRTRPTGYTLTQ